MHEYAVIIISSGRLTKKEKKVLYDYTAEGGSVVTEAICAQSVFNIDLKYSYLKFLYTGADNIFNNSLVCDLYKGSKVSRKANHLENQNNENSILDFSIGKGNVIVFPEGFVSFIHQSGAIRKNFYSPFSSEYTSEQVSRVSKGVIRIHVQKALEYLFHKRNLPFVHLRFFPNDAKNIFSFRVDTDLGTKEEIISLNDLLQNFNITATWFVETKSSQEWIRLFSELKNQEIAYHCYRHRIFLSYEKNVKDIKTGLKVLDNAGIKPKGYAAPYGSWTKTIARVVDKFNFIYSSEFGFAYDALPFYPFYNSVFSKALQIPIHPVSAGRLHWSGHSEENMINYFLNVIERKLIFDEPVILYTHPFEKRLNVFEKVFERIISFNSGSTQSISQKIPILTFSEYAEWWKKRLDINWDAEDRAGKVFILTSNEDKSVKCRVIYPSGDKTILSLSNNEEKKVEEEKIEFNPSYNPNELRKKTLKMIKYDILGKLRKLKQ